MKAPFYFVTGASRGLGAALIELLSRQGISSASLSRSAGPVFEKHRAFQVDLSQTERLPETFQAIYQACRSSIHDEVVLVNNAATVEPIGPAASLDPEKIRENVSLNLAAPAILIRELLARRQEGEFQKLRVVNVSSGVALRPMPTWALYSATKAALHQLSENLAAEFAQDAGATFKNFQPGLIDTEMQALIRAQAVERFPEVARFVEYQRAGKLSSPEEVARRLFEICVE